jgi:hypothetical protein
MLLTLRTLIARDREKRERERERENKHRKRAIKRDILRNRSERYYYFLGIETIGAIVLAMTRKCLKTNCFPRKS